MLSFQRAGRLSELPALLTHRISGDTGPAHAGPVPNALLPENVGTVSTFRLRSKNAAPRIGHNSSRMKPLRVSVTVPHWETTETAPERGFMPSEDRQNCCPVHESAQIWVFGIKVPVPPAAPMPASDSFSPSGLHPRRPEGRVRSSARTCGTGPRKPELPPGHFWQPPGRASDPTQ